MFVENWIDIDAFSNNIFNILGIRPKTVSMDNEYNTDTMRKWSQDTGIIAHFRCSKNSRSIGVERAHQDIHSQWSKVMFGKNPRSWHNFIGNMIDPLNKSVSTVTGVSPYRAVFGIPAPKINDCVIRDNSEEARKRERLYKMIRKRTIDSKLTYSKEHKWPTIQEEIFL